MPPGRPTGECVSPRPWATPPGTAPVSCTCQLHVEDKLGSIEVGKPDDLVVLGANLFKVKSEQMHTLPVLLTAMDGRATHAERCG